MARRSARRRARHAGPRWALRLGLPALVLALVGGLGWVLRPVRVRLSFDDLQLLSPPLRPLLDLIAQGEGDYTSVNRGRAGDTPSGWVEAELGRPITQMTLEELRSHQGGDDARCWAGDAPGAAGLFAVGRYQLIPCTLQLALQGARGVSMDARYDAGTQDALGAWLVLVKRRALGAYLLGQSDDVTAAGQELAMEFASVPVQVSTPRCTRGQSYYCGDRAGNAARISLEAVDTALPAARAALAADPDASQAISAREGLRGRLRRSLLAWLASLDSAPAEAAPRGEVR